MSYSRALCMLCLLVPVYQAAVAGTVPLFLSVDATTFVTKIGKTQSVNLTHNISNTYVPNKHWEDKTSVMFGVGATTYQNNNIIFNTGLRYLNMSNMLANGNVWQLNAAFINPLFYTYRVTTDVVLAENAISYARYIIQPSFILGVGYAQNKATDYQTTALQTFTDRKTGQFAYEVGAGLDYFILKPAVIELAYRLIGAGKGDLGYSALQNTTDRLSTGNIYYHTVSLGIRLYYDHTY